MKLVILTAVLAVCGAAKLDRSYLPPPSAKTAGGSPGELLAPVESLPSGSYTNDAQGVVVDAAAPGTRTAGTEPTGLGGPRISYGSTDSKVGDAAFSRPGGLTRIAPGFGDIVASQGSDNDKTRASTLKFSSNVGLENYSYGFETDNGISVGENGVAADGIKAQGEFSYKGDDGKVYSVSYTADEEGYKPVGSHLPTPPPIPEEILKSLEQNAKEEAAGIVDDGSYDAQKYNNNGAYTSNNGKEDNNRHTVSGGATMEKDNLGVHGVSNQPFGSVQNSNGHSTLGFQTDPQRPGLEFHTHSSQNQFSENYSNQGSVSDNIPALQRNPNLRLPGNLNGNAAYSSAVTTGSGSSTAFASTGNVIPGFKTHFSSVGQTSQFNADSHSAVVNPILLSRATESVAVKGSDTSAEAISTNQQFNENNGYLPPLNTFGSVNQAPHSKFNNQATSTPVPSSATASASVSGQQTKIGKHSSASIQPTQHIHNIPSRFGENSHRITSFSSQSSSFGPGQHTQASGSLTAGLKQIQSSNAHSHYSGGVHAHNSGTVSEIKPTKIPSTELTTPFEPSELSDKTKPALNLGDTNTQFEPSMPTISAFPTYSLQGSNQYQTALGSLKQPEPNSFVPDISKPTINAQHGTDSSYRYNQPSNTFNSPSSKLKGDKLTSTQTGQYQGTASSNYNGITQASISPFPSAAPTTSTQFDSHTNQFEVKPPNVHDTFIQTHFQGTGYQHDFIKSPVNHFDQKSSLQTSSQTQGQKHQQGTIYEYKKPFSSQESFSKHVTSSQTSPQTNPGEFSLSNKQPKPFDNRLLSSSLQQLLTPESIFNWQSTTQFGQKPVVQNQSMQSSQNANYQNPSTTSIYEYNKPSSYEEITSTSTQSQSKPGQQSFGSQTTQLINEQNKPFGSKAQSYSFQQTQNKGSSVGLENTNQLLQKTHMNQNLGSVSPFQSQFGQFTSGLKLSGSSHTGSTFQQTPFVSLSASQSSNKPLSQTQSSVEQNQFGSPGSQFEQKPIASLIDNSSGQHNQSTLYEYKRPTENLSPDKESPPLSAGSQVVQNFPITQELKPQVGRKPTSDSQSLDKFQQNQTPPVSTIGTEIENQFGEKHPGSTFQQIHLGSTSALQLGQKPASTLGSSFASSQGQTAQFVNQPNLQVGPINQQNQFGTSPPQSGKKQSSESHLISSAFSHRENSPLSPNILATVSSESKYQQSQFVSNFGQKPQPNGQSTSNFANANKYGQKPLNIPSSTGNSIFHIQANSSPATQFAQDTQKTQGSQNFSPQIQTPFGKKPSSIFQTGTSIQQTSESSSGFEFDQKPQTSISIPTSQSVQIAQFDQKPFGIHQFSSFSQQTGPQFGQKAPKVPNASFTFSTPTPTQITQFGVKPFSSLQDPGASVSQTDIGSSSQFNQLKPQSGKEIISATAQVQHTSLYDIKPLGVHNSFQQNPYSAAADSEFNQIGQSQFGVKSFSSTQNAGSTISKTNSPFGSLNGKRPSFLGSQPLNSTVRQVSQTPIGIQAAEPLGNTQTQFSSFTGQKSCSSTNACASNTGSPSQLSDREEFNGYNYQKPLGTRFGQQSKPGKVQLDQTNFGSPDSHSPLHNFPKPSAFSTYVGGKSAITSDSRKTIPFGSIQGSQDGAVPPFGIKPTKTVGSGVRPTDGLNQFGIPSSQTSFEQVLSANPTYQLTDRPTQSAIANPQKPSQTSQPLSGSTAFASAQSTASPFVSSGSNEDSSNEGSNVSTVQTPVTSDKVIPSRHSFIGKGEEFGGPRNPPRFDDKTGYHY